MSNIKDGGYLILGVEQNPDDIWTPNGMSGADYDSFTQDNVSAHVAEYADPFVELSVSKQIHDDKRFVVLQIQEFHELPVICKRDGRENLVKGKVYTRTRRMYESAPVPSQTEMREIIDMAVDKSNDVFSDRMIAIIQNAVMATSENETADSNNLFDQQLGDI